jgi:hypothetical protein
VAHTTPAPVPATAAGRTAQAAPATTTTSTPPPLHHLLHHLVPAAAAEAGKVKVTQVSSRALTSTCSPREVKRVLGLAKLWVVTVLRSSLLLWPWLSHPPSIVTMAIGNRNFRNHDNWWISIMLKPVRTFAQKKTLV